LLYQIETDLQSTTDNESPVSSRSPTEKQEVSKSADATTNRFACCLSSLVQFASSDHHSTVFDNQTVSAVQQHLLERNLFAPRLNFFAEINEKSTGLSTNALKSTDPQKPFVRDRKKRIINNHSKSFVSPSSK
jgi:hypothetical protein